MLFRPSLFINHPICITPSSMILVTIRSLWSAAQLREGQGEASGCQQSQGLPLQGEWDHSVRLKKLSASTLLTPAPRRALTLASSRTRRCTTFCPCTSLAALASNWGSRGPWWDTTGRISLLNLREVQSVSEDPAPLTLQPQEELKDLESYIQGWGEEDVVEETEVETIDKVKQVLIIISMGHYIT